MLKTLMGQIKEFKSDSLKTPMFMVLEVLMETLIPLLMASIIDDGVEAGNMRHIYIVGGIMVVVAAIGLFAGIMGGKYGARASTGFARNLREAMYTNIQTFSFSNIDKFSTAGLVTRMTTDVTNIQNAYQMILRMCTRAPISLICAMVMAFFINARIASIYLIAVIFLAICINFIARGAMKYFGEVFKKYDDLNASVQENISAQRVVKAYVREDYEIDKFHKVTVEWLFCPILVGEPQFKLIMLNIKAVCKRQFRTVSISEGAVGRGELGGNDLNLHIRIIFFQPIHQNLCFCNN